MLLQDPKGADSPLIWEALALGAMPVKLRNTGLDRTFHQLPVLQVDSLEQINAEAIQRAYVEALYHRNTWRFEAITQAWYERLVYRISDAYFFDSQGFDM